MTVRRFRDGMKNEDRGACDCARYRDNAGIVSEFGIDDVCCSRGKRSASATRKSAQPAPVNALVRTV
jgi:hypothetical protein